jgi:hypothetical protein
VILALDVQEGDIIVCMRSMHKRYSWIIGPLSSLCHFWINSKKKELERFKSLNSKKTQMCGINGLLLASPSLNAAPELYEGLGLLQHRGQVWLIGLWCGTVIGSACMDRSSPKRHRTLLGLSLVATRDDCTSARETEWSGMCSSRRCWPDYRAQWALVMVSYFPASNQSDGWIADCSCWNVHSPISNGWNVVKIRGPAVLCQQSIRHRCRSCTCLHSRFNRQKPQLT